LIAAAEDEAFPGDASGEPSDPDQGRVNQVLIDDEVDVALTR